MSEIGPLLIINRSASECAECCKGADPHEEQHDTVLSWSRNPPPGCGARWTHVTSMYMGQDEVTAAMRPDLVFVPPQEALAVVFARQTERRAAITAGRGDEAGRRA